MTDSQCRCHGEITCSFDCHIDNLGAAFTSTSKDLPIPIDNKALSGWFACIGFDDGQHCDTTDRVKDQLAIEGSDIGLWDWLVWRYASSHPSLLIHCTNHHQNGAIVSSSVMQEDIVKCLDGPL